MAFHHPCTRSRWSLVAILCALASLLVPGIASAGTAPEVEPMEIECLDSGLVDWMQIGKGEIARRVDFAYDTLGRLETVTDPEGELTVYSHDDSNRVNSITLPDLETVSIGHDANGNITSITPPSRPAHGFVVDVATGVVVQEVRYDEFGRITLATGPATMTPKSVVGPPPIRRASRAG